jgi:hypothetical protein
MEDALANPAGIDHCAFQRQITQLIEGVDEAKDIAEFEAIDNYRGI